MSQNLDKAVDCLIKDLILIIKSLSYVVKVTSLPWCPSYDKEFAEMPVYAVGLIKGLRTVDSIFYIKLENLASWFMVRPGSNPNTNEPAAPKQETGIRTKEIWTKRVNVSIEPFERKFCRNLSSISNKRTKINLCRKLRQKPNNECSLNKTQFFH